MKETAHAGIWEQLCREFIETGFCTLMMVTH